MVARSILKSLGNPSPNWLHDLTIFKIAVALGYTLINLFSLIPGLRFLSAYDAFIPKTADNHLNSPTRPL